MSRQEKRAKERKLRKALRKISLAAGEGVGRAVAFSFVLSSSSAIAAEPEKKEEEFALPPVVVTEQNPYTPPGPCPSSPCLCRICRSKSSSYRRN